MIKDYKNSDVAFQHIQKKHPGIVRGSLKKIIIVISLLVLVFSLLLVFIQAKGPKVIVTQWGRMVDQFEGQGLLIRSEQVVYAPFAGTVRLLAEEGVRYPGGEPVLELTGSNGHRTFYSRDAGVIGYQLDGLETTLQPMILNNFQQNYQDYRGKGIRVQDGDQVNAGRPLFKVVDNYELFLLVEAPKDQVARYRVNEKVWTTMDGVESIGYVRKILDYRNMFVIQLERFPLELLNQRWVNLTVMSDAEIGVILPMDSVVIKNGKMGVYQVVNGHAYFEEVAEQGHNQTEMVVTGIQYGIDILANPKEDLEKYIYKPEK